MIEQISAWLYRWTNRYTILPVAILFLLHLFVILPSESDVDRIVGSFGGVLRYFRYFIYSPSDFYTVIGELGEAGRVAFIDHRVIRANIFIFSIGSFFTVCTGALLRIATSAGGRLRVLNVVGIVPAACDLVENHTQMVLVALYPERFDAVVVVISGFTAVKWVSLFAAMAIFTAALAGAAVCGVSRRLAK